MITLSSLCLDLQVIGVCKNHAAMSKGGLAFRGDLRYLQAIIAVTMQTTASVIARELNRQSAPFPNPVANPAGWSH